MKRLPAYLVFGGLFILIYGSCTESRVQTKESQESSVEQRGQQKTETPAEIVGEDGAPMDLIPAGSFAMGSPEGVRSLRETSLPLPFDKGKGRAARMAAQGIGFFQGGPSGPHEGRKGYSAV